MIRNMLFLVYFNRLRFLHVGRNDDKLDRSTSFETTEYIGRDLDYTLDDI